MKSFPRVFLILFLLAPCPMVNASPSVQSQDVISLRPSGESLPENHPGQQLMLGYVAQGFGFLLAGFVILRSANDSKLRRKG